MSERDACGQVMVDCQRIINKVSSHSDCSSQISFWESRSSFFMSHGVPESHQPAPAVSASTSASTNTDADTATHADSDGQRLALPGPSRGQPLRDNSSATTLLPPQTHGEASVHGMPLLHFCVSKPRGSLKVALLSLQILT